MSQTNTKDHAALAGAFIKDEERVDWHDGALWYIREKRDIAAETGRDFGKLFSPQAGGAPELRQQKKRYRGVRASAAELRGRLELLDIPGRWGKIDAFGRGRVHVAGRRSRRQLGLAEEIMPKQKRKNGKKARVTA